MKKQVWIRLGILRPWWVLFLWTAAMMWFFAWVPPVMAGEPGETILAAGEVLAVTDTAVTIRMETEVKEFPLDGAVILLNGEEVSPGALAPITPEDLVEVKVVSTTNGVRVEGWYQVREVLVLGWDPVRGTITVIPAEGDLERPVPETYRLAGDKVKNLLREGQIRPGQDILLVLDSGGRVKNIAAGTW